LSEIYISQIITVVIVAAGFIGNALYLRGNFSARLDNTEEDIRNLKDSVRYEDTCEAITEGFKDRIFSLEKTRNSK